MKVNEMLDIEVEEILITFQCQTAQQSKIIIDFKTQIN